jgi:hypothetical protein
MISCILGNDQWFFRVKVGFCLPSSWLAVGQRRQWFFSPPNHRHFWKRPWNILQWSNYASSKKMDIFFPSLEKKRKGERFLEEAVQHFAVVKLHLQQKMDIFKVPSLPLRLRCEKSQNDQEIDLLMSKREVDQRG